MIILLRFLFKIQLNISNNLIQLRSLDISGGEFALVASLGSLTGQQFLPVRVKVKFGDDTVGRVDRDLVSLLVDLGVSDTLDVDDIFLSVTCDNLTISSSVSSTDDLDLIILTDRDRTDVVLSFKILAQRSAHDLSTFMRRGSEMSLALLAAR